ncbi:hypothetical protein CBR_g20195 [Chara braunii]|uniref:Uncharacterized protein n=1 Tax=Chara braunii TaxID=69332 RepID=A0A388KZS5_CHABU|nr:hypothetical protein CBR_g20195 [Chara braunii]|eukprot:GBG75564.1 hypothetical protein CBR_g20195 [Chara braunii]
MGLAGETSVQPWPLTAMMEKDVGACGGDSPEGACGFADTDVGDAWTGGAVDIAGTQCGTRGSMGSQSDFHAQPDNMSNKDGGQRAGRPDAVGKGNTRAPDWNLDESLGLLWFLFGEDTLRQSRREREKIRGKKEKYKWIISNLIAKGFEKLTILDCGHKTSLTAEEDPRQSLSFEIW